MGLSSFLIEDWAWFSLGVVIILARFVSRIRVVGIKGLQGDDYMTIGTLVFFTMDALLVHITYYTGQNVGITHPESLSQKEIARLEYGSKLEVTAWYTYASLLWCLKFTMLFFYRRITTGTLYHKKLVNTLFYLNGVAYLIIFVVVSAGCYPFQMNWQVVPAPPEKCSFRPQNTIVVSILNVLTDLTLLAIPIPMLWKLKVPLRKKFFIGIILSSGIFVITAAIIRAVLTLSGTPSAQKINEWGIRETIIGIITVNVPVLRPFFTAAFWRWGPYDPHGSSRMTNSTEGRSKQTRTGNKDQYQSQIVTGKGDIEMGIMTVRPMGNGGSPSSSQENILLKDDKVYDVVVETSYAITSSEREEEAQMGRYNSIGVPH